MKLSELTYDYLCSVGLQETYMQTLANDELHTISSRDSFDRVKWDLMALYGDVDITVDPDADWYDRIRIDDAKWRADFEDYCRRKAEWCKHNTAE